MREGINSGAGSRFGAAAGVATQAAVPISDLAVVGGSNSGAQAGAMMEIVLACSLDLVRRRGEQPLRRRRKLVARVEQQEAACAVPAAVARGL